MIRCRTLGALELTDAGGQEHTAVLAQPKRLALLVYLAVANPRGFHRRDTLLALFWPELDQERARAALRQALTFLRHELGDVVIRTRGLEAVGVDPQHLWCDVVAFEDALQGGDPERALEVDRGEFLAGFHISDCVEFERWLEQKRHALRDRAAEAAALLVERAEAAGSAVEAARWARRIVMLRPDDEPSVRRLMLLLNQIGDRAGALREYDALARGLAAAYDAEPSLETRAIVIRLRSRNDGAASTDAEVRQHAEWTGDPSATKPSSALSERPWPHRRHSRTLVAVGMLAAGITIAVPLLKNHGDDVLGNRVLVLPFDNRTGLDTLSMLSVIVADWLAQGLTQVEGLQVVPTSDVLRGVPVSESQVFHDWDPELARALRAGIVVTGWFHKKHDSLVFDAQLLNTESRLLIGSLSPVRAAMSYPSSGIDQLRSRVAGAVAAHLHVRLTGSDLSRTGSFPTLSAYHKLVEGLQAFGRGELSEAATDFRASLDEDSTFLLAASLAALMHRNLDQWAQVDSLAMRMRRLGRSSVDDWVAAYLNALVTGDRSGAMRAAREVARLVPGGGWQFNAGFEAYVSNRPHEALEILESMHPERDSLTGWAPQYWPALTAAYHMLGRHRPELAAARRARRQFPESTLMAYLEARALASLGRLSDVDMLGDQFLTPQTTRLIVEVAEEMEAHGNPVAASGLLRRLVGWYQAQPVDDVASAYHRHVLADAMHFLGRHAEAEALFGALATQFPDRIDFIGHLGVIAARRGDGDSALRVSDRLAESQRPYLFGNHTAWRARIAAASGRPEEAVNLLRAAFEQGLLLHRFAHNGHYSVWDSDWEFRALREYGPYRKLMKPKG